MQSPQGDRLEGSQTPPTKGKGQGGVVAATSLQGAAGRMLPTPTDRQEEGGGENWWPRMTAGGVRTGRENTDVQRPVCARPCQSIAARQPTRAHPQSFPGCTAESHRTKISRFSLFFILSPSQVFH